MGRTREKREYDTNNFLDRTQIPRSLLEVGLRPMNPQNGSNPNLEDNGWVHCSEEQLEEIVLKNLEFVYNQAISKLGILGYDKDEALSGVLRNGHCYGGKDVLTNVIHNTLAYLGREDSVGVDPELIFVDLRQLGEYSLTGMLGLLQQIRPQLSRANAMWCLLMCDLHVGRASVMEIPVGRTPIGSKNGNKNNPVGVAPDLCRFHGGWGYGNGGTNEFPVSGEIECPKRFNLTPAMKALLKKNVAMFAAGYRANMNKSLPSDQTEKNQDMVNSMLSKFREMNLDGNMDYVPEDEKDEMILSLVHQIKDLEGQVKERKEWAHEKAIQAARKLSHDLTEFNMLKMEREETQRVKQESMGPEDPTMKRLTDMENALRKASVQVDRANASVRHLEGENAEIKAEMEAANLSASESVNSCLEIAKREKKYAKRILAWERQKAKLQVEIAAEKQKIADVQEEMVQIEAARKGFEVKLRQEQKAKEVALAQTQEEQRLKEATEASNKRKHEALRRKIDLDFQKHKDDLQRLEQDLARLKMSSQPNTGNNEGPNRKGETIAGLLHELEKEVSYADRSCLICLKDEVSVVFLPCAHQVVCANCNEDYGKKGKAVCPCCRAPIEQRICVFGASS